MQFPVLARALDWFVPAQLLLGDAEAVRRARLAVGISLIGSVALAWASLVQTFWGTREFGIAAAAILPLTVLVPFLLRLTGSLAVMTQALPLLQFCFGGVIVGASGGQALWAFYWFALVPLTAVLVTGNRSGVLWAALTVAAIGAVAWAQHSHVEFPIRPAPEVVAASVFRGAVLATLVTLGVGTIYESLRARAERELAEARRSQEREERRFRTLTEQASDVIIEWNARGRILYISPRAQELTGLPAESFLDFRWRAYAHDMHADDLGPFAETVRSALAARTGTEASLRFRHAEGSWRWLEIKTRTFETAEGELRIVSVARDVTDRHEVEALRQLTKELEESIAARDLAEAELERRNLDLARANRELEEFTSVASHDLQEPLRKLVSFSALLRDDLAGDLPPDARRDLQFIDDGARRMQRLVKDLLALSRAGASPMTRERVAVADCVDRALEDLALRIAESGAQVERCALPELEADPTLLTGIYRNLLSNALKFAGDTPPQIRLSAEQRGGRWILGVADRGIGLAPAEQAEIFKPFRRLATSGATEGSGIGLAFCRKAVERHGGRIWVESRVGEGSHFRFTLGETSAAAGEERV